jgi:hypothetical protein
MDYRYSTVVNPSTYQTEGLCDGIPLRVRRGQEVEDLGAIRAQEDWTKHVGPVGFVKASLGPEYNFLSVAFPEMLPGRMEVLAYFNELIFLHDDIVEAVGKDEVCCSSPPPFLLPLLPLFLLLFVLVLLPFLSHHSSFDRFPTHTFRGMHTTMKPWKRVDKVLLLVTCLVSRAIRADGC